MTSGSGRFLRDNVFLVAAVTLPIVVVAFFLLATAIPRWTVPPPAYDLLISASDYNQANRRITVDFGVRDGKVEATFRPLPAGGYGQPARLFLWDHTTTSIREIAIELPDNLVEGDPPRAVPVDALAGHQALALVTAPDGYQLQNRSQRGPGIVGELFGMHRYNSEASLENRGRVIPIELPGQFQNIYSPGLNAVAWLAPESTNGRR